MDLRVENLGCTRGGMRVLQDVQFTLTGGQALILRGPNGCGKTTLLRTIAGLQPADAGLVSVDPDHIAYAGHQDGLKTTLSVDENLSFWAAIFGTDTVAAAIDAFDLANLKHRLAQNLSAGQKRRLGLARMLVTGRPIWVFDEPTVSLDQASVAMFANAIRQHLQGGGSALIATHIDLGLDADVLDVSAFAANNQHHSTHEFDEAFL